MAEAEGLDPQMVHNFMDTWSDEFDKLEELGQSAPNEGDPFSPTELAMAKLTESEPSVIAEFVNAWVLHCNDFKAPPATS